MTLISEWLNLMLLDALSSTDGGRLDTGKVRASYVRHIARWGEPVEIHCLAMNIKDRNNGNLYIGGICIFQVFQLKKH